jgi:co-chaperonin GroES (HSP10)
MEATMVSNTFDLGTLKFWALGDRVLIEEDKFKSGYECTTCEGTTKVKCEECGGTGRHGVKRCSHCSDGEITCPTCGGKGGLLVAPEISQRRPTTGRVVSVGPDCETLKVGDSVLYSNFAGYVIDLNRAGRAVSLRILHEPEILCAMEGQLELRTLKGKSEIAEFGG